MGKSLAIEELKTYWNSFKKEKNLDFLMRHSTAELQALNGRSFSALTALQNLTLCFNQSQVYRDIYSIYSGYTKAGEKNYVISPNLTEALNTSTLKTSYLPSNCFMYVEMPGLINTDYKNKTIRGVLVGIRPDVAEKVGFTLIAIQAEPGENIKQSTNSALVCQLTESNLTTLPPWALAVLKAVAYIHTKDADITFEKQDYPTQKYKQKYGPTLRGWYSVGVNWHTKKGKKGPLTCGAFKVVGHTRKQPYGKGRSLIKEIWIEPQIRNATNSTPECPR